MTTRATTAVAMMM
jgi:hypothetical protein